MNVIICRACSGSGIARTAACNEVLRRRSIRQLTSTNLRFQIEALYDR